MMPKHKKFLLALIVLLITALGGTMYGYLEQDNAALLDDSSVSGRDEPTSTVTVYVTGAVEKPGVVTIAEGSRYMDAVNACGGLLQTADSENVNLAQTVKDGQKIQIPEKTLKDNKADIQQNNAQKSSGSTASASDTQRININTASLEELDKLPGVGISTAQKIIDYRQTEGAFQSIEDIKKVRGIGSAKYEKMKDKICI